MSSSIFNRERLHPSNRAELDAVLVRYYMQPILQAYRSKIDQFGLPDATDHLTEIMRTAEGGVEALLQKRKRSGEINDIDQARKNLAGNGFQSLVFCALASLQSARLIPGDLVFTLKARSHSKIGESVIVVGPEELKPDVDLLIYSDADNLAHPVCICSLKTSLRERAGQTHRWKVLLDIVTAENCRSIKQKYDLQYAGRSNFLLMMITTNFYDEITSPQQRGLLRFLDYVYLGKPGDFAHPVQRFSSIAADLTRIYDA